MAGKINIYKIKRMVRKNPHTRRMLECIYEFLTGEYIEKKHIRTKGEPVYYVIRPPHHTKKGVMNLWTFALGHIKYAKSKGYIPVVDLEHYDTIYSGETIEGSKNVWEWYFQQPAGVSLAEALSKNYIISRSGVRDRTNLALEFMEKNNKCLEEYCILGGGVKLNRTIEEHIKETRKGLFPAEGKVLGVFYRGTDYVQLKPIGHPVQPSREELRDHIRQCLKEEAYDKIFLATEEKESVTFFQKEFPGMVITAQQHLVESYSLDDSGLLIGDFMIKQCESKYILGMEYLTNIVLLASCDSFVGAMAGGSVAALIMNNQKYKHCQIINLGLY